MRFFNGNDQGAGRWRILGKVLLCFLDPVLAQAAGEDVGHQQVIQIMVMGAEAQNHVAAMFQLVDNGRDGVAGRVFGDILLVVNRLQLAV